MTHPTSKVVSIQDGMFVCTDGAGFFTRPATDDEGLFWAEVLRLRTEHEEDLDRMERAAESVERLTAERDQLWKERDELRETLAHLMRGQSSGETGCVENQSARSLEERHPNSTGTHAGSNPAERANSAPSAAGRLAAEASNTNEASEPATVGADSLQARVGAWKCVGCSSLYDIAAEKCPNCGCGGADFAALKPDGCCPCCGRSIAVHDNASSLRSALKTSGESSGKITKEPQ